MGAGRGKKRRLWKASAGSGPSKRLRLDALPRRHPRYARYVEVLSLQAPDGTAFRVFSVEEYVRSGNAPARRYGVVIDERDAFWAASVRQLELQSPELDPGGYEIAPLAYATYRSVRSSCGLPEHDGHECLVYVVEQRLSDHDLQVPGRCGVRFVGDDSYWVVPAMELDIGPLANVA